MNNYQHITEFQYNDIVIPNRPATAPQVQQKLRNSKLLAGSEVLLKAKIVSNPSPRILWFKNGQLIIPNQRCNLSYLNDIACLQIINATPDDAGYYTLLAENSYGRIVSSAHLVIERAEVSNGHHQVQHVDNLYMDNKKM